VYLSNLNLFNNKSELFYVKLFYYRYINLAKSNRKEAARKIEG